MTQIFPDTSDSARIAELIDRLSRLVQGLQYADGLNPAQWEALRFISRARLGSRTPSCLAEYLGTTKGTTSQTLIALESKGYIRRTKCPDDRRSVKIDLTESGQAVIRQDPLAAVRSASCEIPDSCRAGLLTALEMLVAQLAGSQGLPAFGQCGACSHYRQGCAEASGVGEKTGCRCALSGGLIPPDDLLRLCIDFQGNA